MEILVCASGDEPLWGVCMSYPPQSRIAFDVDFCNAAPACSGLVPEGAAPRDMYMGPGCWGSRPRPHCNRSSLRVLGIMVGSILRMEKVSRHMSRHYLLVLGLGHIPHVLDHFLAVTYQYSPSIASYQLKSCTSESVLQFPKNHDAIYTALSTDFPGWQFSPIPYGGNRSPR